jgi:hypothetical protein
MRSITVIIVYLLVALTPLVSHGLQHARATSRPVVASPIVQPFDVVGGSPTVH